MNPREKGKIHSSTCSQPAQFRGHHAVSGVFQCHRLTRLDAGRGQDAAGHLFLHLCSVQPTSQEAPTAWLSGKASWTSLIQRLSR